MKPQHFILTGLILLLLAGLSLSDAPPGAAQGATQAATAAATQAGTKEPTPEPIKDPLGQPPFFLASYYKDWVGSAHADKDSAPFKHWDAEGSVPGDCARCHSSPGYVEFVNLDPAKPGQAIKNQPIGSVINCDACHNKAAAALKTVAFPSGAVVGDIGDATRCIVCHQGRASTVQVAAAIDKAGLSKDLDKVEAKLGFINVHYFAAAATLYGSAVHGGYEYEGKIYQGRNLHVDGYNTCIGCHDQHTLKVRVEACGSCHKDVKSEEDLVNIRMNGSLADFNGNGDVKEGIAAEIAGLKAILMQQMQAYASKVTGKAIAYDAASYPYFFYDTNGNGKVDKDEAVAANGFKSFTARLLQAAYNYQVSQKDPGNFAHNPKYVIQLLFDSIDSLNQGMGGEGSGQAKIVRNPPAHFNAASEPFRHWDADGLVPGSPSNCAKCHTDSGLPTFLQNGVTVGVKPSNSLACTTCHDQMTPEFTVRQSEKVTFPSGAVLSFGRRQDANICLNCHQGRESTVSVNAAIAASGAKDDVVSPKLNFRNVHYFAAGASLFGNDAQGAYQYAGKKYSGRNLHKTPYQTCVDCHDTHTQQVKFGECTKCHENAKDSMDIRAKEDAVDYNRNGNTDEPIAAEITSFKDALLTQIYSYATKKSGLAIVYDPGTYPYWFIDKNSNGKADPDELKADNGYNKWTPNLLRAAYNYQYVTKDPGSFAHNPSYILQVLYDSVESLGGKSAVAKFIRPEVKPNE
jgi:hypothetical protein